MWEVYNEDIVSKITEEQYEKIDELIDSCVRDAMEDCLGSNGGTRFYDVNYDKGDGYVSINDTEPIISVDGVGVVLSAEISFSFDMESGGGWDEPAWGEFKRYEYSGDVTLFDMEGDEIVAYDTSIDWQRY